MSFVNKKINNFESFCPELETLYFLLPWRLCKEPSINYVLVREEGVAPKTIYCIDLTLKKYDKSWGEGSKIADFETT